MITRQFEALISSLNAFKLWTRNKTKFSDGNKKLESYQLIDFSEIIELNIKNLIRLFYVKFSIEFLHSIISDGKMRESIRVKCCFPRTPKHLSTCQFLSSFDYSFLSVILYQFSLGLNLSEMEHRNGEENVNFINFR